MKVTKTTEGRVNVFNGIELLLSSRGIAKENQYKIIEPTKEFEDTTYEYHNMDKAVSLFKSVRKANKQAKVMICADVDADGFTSYALLYNFFKEKYPELQLGTCVNDVKAHGLTDILLNQIYDYQPDLLILPDCATNDIEQLKQLKEKNIPAIILDHHECEGIVSEDAIVVNNQLIMNPKGANKTLVGVGMCYKFIYKLDKTKAKKYLDLVALGQVADMSDCTNLETRYFITEGIKRMNKNKYSCPFLQKLGLENITIITLGFKIAPLINSVTRMASIEEKKTILEGMVGVNVDKALELALYMKTLQDTQSEEGANNLLSQIEQFEMDKDCIIVCNGDNIYPTIKGMVANKLAQKYKRPVVVVASSGDMFRGSTRGYEKGWLENPKEYFNNMDTVAYCLGHSSANGIGIYKKDMQNFISQIKQIPKANIENLDLSEEVDDIFDVNELPSALVRYVGEYDFIWGNNIKEPIFYVHDIRVNPKYLRVMGKDNNAIKFKGNDIDFLAFKLKEDMIKELSNVSEDKEIVFNVTCRFNLNRYNHPRNGLTITPQCIVDQFEYSIEDKKVLNYF